VRWTITVDVDTDFATIKALVGGTEASSEERLIAGMLRRVANLLDESFFPGVLRHMPTGAITRVTRNGPDPGQEEA
jgi:hypothetical protein